MSDLGRRAVACRAWRWMPGMLDCHGRRWLTESPVGGYPAVTWPATEHAEAGPAVPDLTDPATLGCLLALVREASGEPRLRTRWSGSHREWQIHGRPGLGMIADSRQVCIAHAPTEAEALVLALEAAPVAS